MKKDLTELVFIIDKSGSMYGMQKDTIGGFNSMIENQKSIKGDVLVSTVLFSTESQVLHDRISIDRVEPMTESNYQPNGGTALLDAIGGAIHHIKNIHKYARRSDVPAHTLFIITTDGMENSSRFYSSEQVKKMIKAAEEKHGWEFMFIAANIDAVETASHIGIRPERSANYEQSSVGTQQLYECMNAAVCNMRCENTISADWKEKLNPTSHK